MNPRGTRKRLFFDADDHRLLAMVNKILARGQNPSLLRNLFDPSLHPRGIKELAAPKSLRIAAAMIDLLGSLEQGSPEERLTALQAVHAEALHESSHSLRRNVARVLLQIAKEIIRAVGDTHKQLSLAHDFREAASGKPRLVRRQLQKFNLLEMPESWNQLAFDHHVHDASTKGRKSPTHLIMDAWIKGIRFLGVIYYNELRPEVAEELLTAADIMGIEVRIGIEVSALLRTRPVHLIWAPRGFLGREDFLRFLREPEVSAFFAKGREVIAYQRSRVLDLLHQFNAQHRSRFNQEYGLDLDPLDPDAFLQMVGQGQASRVHLAEFALAQMQPLLQAKIRDLAQNDPPANALDARHIEAGVQALKNLDSEALVEQYFCPSPAPPVDDSAQKPDKTKTLPALLTLSTEAMIDTLEQLPCRSRITLNPSKLSAAEVLEVLYAGAGRITHLEIFNMKDWAQGRIAHREQINALRLVINSGNVVEAKRLVREIIAEHETPATSAETADPTSPFQANQDQLQLQSLNKILRDLSGLLNFYRSQRLRSRLGSDSIGHSRHSRGMGLVVVDTLPRRAQRRLRQEPDRLIPVATQARRHTMVIKGQGRGLFSALPMHRQTRTVLPEQRRLVEVSWSIGHNSTTLSKHGNIASLGGRPETIDNDLSPKHPKRVVEKNRPSLGQLNTGVLNLGKIAVGFIPAFVTFYFTKDWWLLAYFGALIWFFITGSRNILQSVVGGAGLRNSSLLNWRDLVSWSRVADSLLYTGFSVPLLDFVVKDQFLAQGLDITTSTNPLALFSVMALANGIYISSHNTFRGLPPSVIVGNFFRSVLSIPVAVALNFVLLKLITHLGLTQAAALASLQLWAAIISKFSSDTVAAVIEGTADRNNNLLMRRSDYKEKLTQVFDVYARLETAFPEQEALDLLKEPNALFFNLRNKHPLLLRNTIIDALDLLYLWMYQPRAQSAFKQMLLRMSAPEQEFFLKSQQVLRRKRYVSELLLNGLVGKHFERALAFYLAHSDHYLEAMNRRQAKS